MVLRITRILPIFVLLTTLLPFSPLAIAQAQDAEVIFYSNASALKLALPYTKHGAFVGWIFDGHTKIATIRYRRFVTLRFTPGAHVFSASYSSRHPAKNSQFSLDLEAGHSYFIRAEADVKNVVVLGTHRGQLEEVSCQTAHTEAGDIKPLKDKYVPPGVRSQIVPLTSMPPCK